MRSSDGAVRGTCAALVTSVALLFMQPPLRGGERQSTGAAATHLERSCALPNLEAYLRSNPQALAVRALRCSHLRAWDSSTSSRSDPKFVAHDRVRPRRTLRGRQDYCVSTL